MQWTLSLVPLRCIIISTAFFREEKKLFLILFFSVFWNVKWTYLYIERRNKKKGFTISLSGLTGISTKRMKRWRRIIETSKLSNLSLQEDKINRENRGVGHLNFRFSSVLLYRKQHSWRIFMIKCKKKAPDVSF